ncbi:hypothetical protein LDENG_00084880 [Lucifuga dentata]|nr:hypothetical protein LDENG_00084880 [Lucifuga dentata]
MNLLRVAAVCLALLCPLILAVMTGLGIQNIQNQINCNIKTDQLLLNTVDLTIERDELQTNNTELKRIFHEHSEEINVLQRERRQLNATMRSLTNQIQELKKRFAKTIGCPEKWMRFGGGCYSISDSTKDWYQSKTDCEKMNAHLVIISSPEEQQFISNLYGKAWIGLTDQETENVFKWVNGSIPNATYWDVGEPNNKEKKENCVVNTGSSAKWRDVVCTDLFHYICQRYVGY